MMPAAAHAAAHREGDEDLLRDPLYHLYHGLTVLCAGGDVQEHQLVGALAVVEFGHFGRVSGVAKVHEADAFDYPSPIDVKTGNDSFG